MTRSLAGHVALVTGAGAFVDIGVNSAGTTGSAAISEEPFASTTGSAAITEIPESWTLEDQVPSA